MLHGHMNRPDPSTRCRRSSRNIYCQRDKSQRLHRRFYNMGQNVFASRKMLSCSALLSIDMRLLKEHKQTLQRGNID
jgi:hypothetical protein